MLLALAYELAGKSQLAVSTYSQVLERSPKDIRIIIAIVAALQRVNQYDRADDILRRAASEKLVSPQLQNLQWQNHLRHGELDSAANILENLFNEDPNNTSVCMSLALLRMQQNQFEQAEPLLARLRAEQPNSVQIAALQVNMSVRRDRPLEALSLCDELVENKKTASAHILRARTHATFESYDKSQEDLDRAAAIEPKNPAVWVARTDFFYTTGRLDKATEQIQRALSIVPDSLQIQKRAIQLFLNSTNPQTVQEAKRILAQALESHPNDIQLRLVKARLRVADGTAPALEQATQIIKDITENNPKSIDAWLLLGEIMLRQGRYEQAIDAVRGGRIQEPNNRKLLLLLARAEAEMSPAFPIATLKLLLELFPEDTEILLLLAKTYCDADSPEKAITLLNEYINEFSDEAQKRKISIALAEAFYKNKDKERAQQEFHRLYQSAPDDPEVLKAHAELLAEDKLWSRIDEIVKQWCSKNTLDTSTPVAVAANLVNTESSGARKIAEIRLRSVLSRDQNCIPAKKTLALLLQITGKPTEATEIYNSILKVKPDDFVVMNNLAWILCQEQDNPQKALELTQRALKVAPPNYIDIIDTQGIIYHRLGEYEKASRLFTSCLKLYLDGTPSAVVSRFHLGKTFASLGQKDKAAASLRKALVQNSMIEGRGLSPTDVDEAERLISELSEGT
jgi:tetratricopeptide (TPR) repeat protein